MASSSVVNIPALLFGLTVGAIVMYFRRDERQVVVYPSPDNTAKVQYTDAAGACFEYVQSAIKCPVRGAISAPLQ
jgi:hypothetical protein